jgi:mono/diheme cytochrome c family protein
LSSHSFPVRQWSRRVTGGLAGLTSFFLCSCAQRMDVEPKYTPLAASDFFRDGQSARPAVAGTVARGEARVDPLLNEGRAEGLWADSFPFPITKQVMERGQQRYEIYCSPCHGLLGDGQGMVVRRGLQGPVSFHDKRFLEYPAGYFFNVITYGRGAMYPYAARIAVNDRWAIVVYVRALQLSRSARLGDVPPDRLKKLEEQKP